MLERWEAHYTLQPWGGFAEDQRLGIQLMNLVQAIAGGKPRTPGKPSRTHSSWTVADFAPRRWSEQPTARRQESETARRRDAERTAKQNAQVLDAAGWVDESR